MLLFVPLAAAFDSEPQAVRLEDLADTFAAAEFSTGYVPSGSPIQVQFAVESTGGVAVSMEGDANLSWPAALTLQYLPTAGSGLLLLDASIDAVTSIAIDLSDWGYYGTFEVDRRSLPMDADTSFDPFVLAGAIEPTVEVTDPGDSTTLIDYSYDILPGLSLVFDASIRPEATVDFTGVGILANGSAITAEEAAIAIPYETTGELLVETVYEADWNATLDLVIRPELQVCADPFGCVTVAAFDLPINLLDDAFRQDFPPIYPVFPLPLIEAGLTDADFGDVDVGTLANLDLPVENRGMLVLSGTVRIDGGTDFRVYPETFTALPAGSDGLVVTFAPTIDGAQTATLVLSSNDPGRPDVSIPLVGNAVPGDVPGTDEIVVTKPLDGCGCATGVGSAPWGAVLLLGSIAARRRR